MTSDDLKRIFTGRTLFRLDTILSPRMIPIIYAMGLLALLLWAARHFVEAVSAGFWDGVWSLLEIAAFGGLGVLVLRAACEALLVWFKANEEAADDINRARISTSLLEEVRDAIRDIADEEDEEEDVDVDDLITPATVPAPDIEITPPRGPRRTARRTPMPKP
jgi:hypothetical protein